MPRVAVTNDQVVAFRLAMHRLAVPVPLDDVAVGAAMGVRERPPDGAGPALRARTIGLTVDGYRQAVTGGSLVAVYAMRGAVHVVPGDDAATFAAGSLPVDEAEARAALGDAAVVFGDGGAVRAVEAVAEEITQILAGSSHRSKGQVSEALHGRVPQAWEPWCQSCEAQHVPDGLFRLAMIAAGSRVVSHRPTTFAAAAPPPVVASERRDAAAELARRFLHHYGPARAEQFAAWRGFAAAGSEAFGLLGDAITEVHRDGYRAWVLREDLDLLADPPRHAGVTMLGRDDPFIAQRDRDVLAPTKDIQRRLWTSVGSTAAVIADGELVALWRGRKRGRRLTVTVEPLRRLTRAVRDGIETGAHAYAPFRDAESATVEVVKQ